MAGLRSHSFNATSFGAKPGSAKLLDSIAKGYPIVPFILWKTIERLRAIRNLGGSHAAPLSLLDP
jgi:hypothetical protein